MNCPFDFCLLTFEFSMICIASFIVFCFLGIFSAKYRVLAKESLSCVFKRLTFKPCDTGLDRKIKARLTGKFMDKYPRFAKFLYLYFEALSWIFIALMLASFIISAKSVYNLVVHGTCNPQDPASCVFTPPIE